MTGAGWTSWGVPLKDPEMMEAIEAPRHKNFRRAPRLRYLVRLGLAVEQGFDDAGVDPVEAFGAKSQRDLQDDVQSERNPQKVADWVRQATAEAAVADFVE